MVTTARVDGRETAVGHDPDVRETTRLLCAAAYVNDSFARKVVDTVVEDRHHAAAPAFGVDVAPVVRHCIAALRRSFVRDLLLTGLILVNVLLHYAGVTETGAVARILLLGWATVLVFACLNRFQVLPTLTRDAFRPQEAPVPTAEDQTALTDYDRQAHGNVSVYSGFSPFVGAGHSLENWSFTTDLRRGKETHEGRLPPRPFEVDELYDWMAAALRDLGIPRLEVTNRLFVNGQDVRAEMWLLPDQHERPVVEADAGRVRHYMRSTDDRIRHYLVIQVPGWQGEMVVSVFLRFAITGSDLFTEASYWVLPPLRESYHSFDGYNPVPDLRVAAGLVGRTVLTTIPLLVKAPFVVLKHIWDDIFGGMSERSLRRRITADPMFDFGAARSIREIGMSRNLRRYFQRSDREMHVKQIEYRLFDALTAFLDNHHIDTEDARATRVTVINSGLMMTGGSLRAGNVAVGTGAQAIKTIRKFTRRPT